MKHKKVITLILVIAAALLVASLVPLFAPGPQVEPLAGPEWYEDCPPDPSTRTPWPEQPTLTPRPTLTPQPTYTPQPTPTCRPTATLAPNPSPTPYPTHAPHPTHTPYPTSTPYPPPPTPGPHLPTPTPTNTPIATPTPTSTPETVGAYYVATNGDDSNPGTEAQPFRTIQHAADLTRPGDTVLIRGGTYAPFWIKYSGAENQPITFRNYPGERPVIDGALRAGKGIVLRHHTGPLEPIGWVTIDGLEVFRASQEGLKGYRIHHVVIRNCSIHHSHEENILVSGSHHVTLEANRIYEAGHHNLYASGNYWTVVNNLFFGADYRIMQLYPYTHDRPEEFRHLKHWKIFNNVFAFNRYQTGLCLGSHYVGNIPGEVRDVEIYNNTFYGNAGRAINLSPANPNIKGVSIHHNVHYDNLAFIGGGTGEGTEYEEYDNYNVDPLFVHTDQHHFDNNDFHLQATSPAIDAGVEPRDVEGNLVTTDFDGNPRPRGAGYDIGAYETSTLPTPTPTPEIVTAYYVATDGNDSNPGTITEPWRTLAYAAAQVGAGDTVYVRGGTYAEAFTISANGTVANRITFQAYQDENPVVDGKNTLPTGAYPGVKWVPLVHLTGDYVTLSGFEVRNSRGRGIETYRSSHCKIAGCAVHHCWGQGILTDYADYPIVEGCAVYECARSNAPPNRWAENWDAGLTAHYGEYAVFWHNTVYNNHGEGLSGFFCPHSTFEDNTTYDNLTANLYIDNMAYPLVQRNLVYSTSDTDFWWTEDAPGPGIAISDEDYGPPAAGTHQIVINNISIGNGVNLHFWQDIAGGGLKNAVIANNTLVQAVGAGANGSTGIKITPGDHSGSIVKGNIIYQTIGTLADVASAGLDLDHNCWFDNGGNTPETDAQGARDINDDPGLADPAHVLVAGLIDAAWYKLLSVSPCQAAGIALADVTEDYWKTIRSDPPDIGAHEQASLDRRRYRLVFLDTQ